MTDILTPDSAGPVAQAIEAAIAQSIPDESPLREITNPATAPASVLPWIAWAIGIDWWSDDWTTEQRRTIIGSATLIHLRKGTPWAIREAMRVMGFGSSQLHEDYSLQRYDGQIPRDGTALREANDHWADYRLTVSRPITVEQAGHIRRVLDSIAPVRCRLRELNYSAAAHVHNGTLARDGNFTRGTA